jgi:hypothetical protein
LKDAVAEAPEKRLREAYHSDLIKIMDRKEELIRDRNIVDGEIRKLTVARNDCQKRIDSIKVLIELLRTEKPEKLIELRFRLREQLRKLLKKIDVYAVGLPTSIKERVYDVYFTDSSFSRIQPGFSKEQKLIRDYDRSTKIARRWIRHSDGTIKKDIVYNQEFIRVRKT